MTATLQSPLYVVEADYQCNQQLAGHTGCSYASPPQPAAQALALVRMLLSCPQQPLSINDTPWRRPAAGGTLTVRLHVATRDGQLTL